MKITGFEFNLFGVNTYVTWDPESHEAAVVDPGMSNKSENETLDRFISEYGLKVTHLLFTHLHIDHTLGAEHVMERYGVRPEANDADAFLGQQRDMQSSMFHLRVSPGPLEIDNIIREGDVIKFGNDELAVLLVPGHSPGSVVFWNSRERFVITGDVLFNGSIGRTDLPGGNHALLVEGIRQKLMALPEDTTVYPGHGPATTIWRELRSNPFIR